MENNLLQNRLGLVLNGGGILGVAHLGALDRLDDFDIKINQFKYFAGTSVGSVIASALSCGATIDFIKQILSELVFENFKDDDSGFIRDGLRLWFRSGIYKGNYLEKWCYNILGTVSGNPAITFREIYEQYGNYLCIPVMKNYEQTIYYDHLKTPDMPVFKAVRRSSGIPLFYQGDVDEDYESDDDSDLGDDGIKDMYVDGGVLDNFPFHCLEEHLPVEQILGLKLMSSKQLWEIKYGKRTVPPKNILEAIMKLVTALRDQALRLHEKTEYWDNTIKIDIGDMSSTDFDLSDTDRDWLFSQGRQSVDKFIESCLKK